MGERRGGIAANRHQLWSACPISRRGSSQAAEIVEAKFWCGKTDELRRGLRVQVPQQAIAETVVRQRTQLFLHHLERAAKRRATGQDLVEIERAEIEAHRKLAGEPAHRAREIDVFENLLDRKSTRLNSSHLVIS